MRVAVVGATGVVGRTILDVMAERSFAADEVVAFASSRTAGHEVPFRDGANLTVEELRAMLRDRRDP